MKIQNLALIATSLIAGCANVRSTDALGEGAQAAESPCLVLCIEETRLNPNCVCVPIPGSGRDCTGIGLCIEGHTWSAKACGCIPNRPEPCGGVKCGAGQVCCNESCGICTEPGGVCTQQYCG